MGRLEGIPKKYFMKKGGETNMFKFINWAKSRARWLCKQDGVTVPEYALMLALVAVAVIAATPTLKDGILAIFDYIASNLNLALGTA